MRVVSKPSGVDTPETPVALVVRQQAWFRPSVSCESLAPFQTEEANTVCLEPMGVLRARVLIGCGPLEHELQPEFCPWFSHGEDPYPVLECPSIGPKGAGLYARTRRSRITASKDEAVCLIEVSLVQPVEPALADEYTKEQQCDLDEAGRRVLGPASELVERMFGESKKCLDQAIGLYALYQYPIVWELFGVCPLLAFANRQTQTLKQMTPLPVDNFTPFRLNAKEKVRDGCLVDDALADLYRLEAGDLHLPLVLLQRALWQKNVQVRFLESFWVIEHLAGRCKVTDNDRQQREDLYGAIEQFVRKKCPQHQHRVRSLKSAIVQPPLKQRLAGYFAFLGIDNQGDLISRMLQLRNNLSHGGNIDPHELGMVELDTRVLVRKVMQKELAARGVRFGAEPTA